MFNYFTFNEIIFEKGTLIPKKLAFFISFYNKNSRFQACYFLNYYNELDSLAICGKANGSLTLD